MPKAPTDLSQFESLLEIVATLRGPEGCPWDKAQTLRSLTSYAIEEAHEYAHAVESEDTASIVDELGDLLLQVVLNSQVGKDNGDFEFRDVVTNLNNKLVRRHPHVFADASADSEEDVRKQWEKIKAQEPKKKKDLDGFDISPTLPALQRAYEIGRKTKKEDFDWPNLKGVWAKLEEETQELQAVIDPLDKERCQEELGDLLFSAAQLARHLDLEPEQCLRQANSRFEKRFFKMKALAQSEGKSFDKLEPSEKESFWQQAKAFEKDQRG